MTLSSFLHTIQKPKSHQFGLDDLDVCFSCKGFAEPQDLPSVCSVHYLGIFFLLITCIFLFRESFRHFFKYFSAYPLPFS